MRIAIAAAVTCLSVIGVTATAQVHAAIRQHTEIQAEPLDLALRTLAKERGFQLVYLSENVGALQTHGAKGEFTVDEALKTLLSDSGLEYKFVDDNTVSIFPRTRRPSPSGYTTLASEDSSGRDSKRTSGEYARLAQANQGVVQNSSAVGSDAQSTSVGSESSPRLTEILVTAEKRTERQQDVPIAMTVLNPETLAENGQNRLVDYFASVPGLNVSSGANGAGTNYLTIRGLSAGFLQNAIVATVIDDVPTTSSNERGYGGLTSPDLDPSDLERIEVLKGPQGTLYGADSLGGLIKYVTIDPSTTAFSGRVEVAGVAIPDGGLGYAVRGAVNIPVSDIFAIRASAFSRRDPGYIDNLTTGQKNFNSTDVYGGHIAGLLRPSDNFSMKLSALVQESHGGESFFDSNISGQSVFGNHLGLTTLPGTTPYTTQDQLYAATVDWKVAGLDIVSVTGYVVNTLNNWIDDTSELGSFACGFFIIATCPSSGLVGVPYLTNSSTHKISEELRIGSSVGGWLDWRLGGFYTHEDNPRYYFDFYGANPTTGTISGLFYGGYDPIQVFHEYAAFGDLTTHITDRFDIEFGGRESWNKQEDQIITNGTAENIFDGTKTPPPYVFPLTQASGSAFTYQVTPKFKISPDLMAYARVATGYRIGGWNEFAFQPNLKSFGIPASFAPDKTMNYEVGMKGDLLDHKLSFAAAAYYIDWKNFQINVKQPFSSGGLTLFEQYTANAGNAKSEGLELSLDTHPLQGLTITAETSYDNAVLTQDLPAGSTAYGLAGDRLPYSLRFSGGLTMNQDIRLSSDWMGFVGGSVNYVGSRPYEFTTSASQPRIEYPAYTQLNLRTGAHYESWLINLYLNNVTDARGIANIQPSFSLGNSGGYYATVIQPRTVGLSISKTF